jgi:hypothetical protein
MDHHQRLASRQAHNRLGGGPDVRRFVEQLASEFQDGRSRHQSPVSE